MTQSRLQRELKQSKPFRSAGHEAVLSVLKTADLLRRRMSELLAPLDLTPQQYNVLRILRGAGSDGVPTLAIGERLIEEAPGMTRLLDRMEEKGLVRRHRCDKDRRQVLCWITPAGMTVLEKLDPAVAEWEETGVKGLRVSEARALIECLERMRDSLEPAASADE
jgi:DNA-binding MarR family transcriptional regulator